MVSQGRVVVSPSKVQSSTACGPLAVHRWVSTTHYFHRLGDYVQWKSKGVRKRKMRSENQRLIVQHPVDFDPSPVSEHSWRSKGGRRIDRSLIILHVLRYKRRPRTNEME